MRAASSPTDYGFGTHRVPLEQNFLEAFHRPNVEIVSVKDNPIERVTPEASRRRTARSTSSTSSFWRPGSTPERAR